MCAAEACTHFSSDGMVSVRPLRDESRLKLGRESIVLESERCIPAEKERFIVPATITS